MKTSSCRGRTRRQLLSLILCIFFCRLPFSLRHLPASWTSLICWKTRWAPRRGVLASTLPPPLPPPPCSTTPRLPSQAWVAAMAICRSRWGPTCCTPTAAEDCPTSYSQVRLTVGRPCWCPSQATVAAAWQDRKSVFWGFFFNRKQIQNNWTLCACMGCLSYIFIII